MTAAELRTRIDTLSTRLHRLAGRPIADARAGGYTRKITSQTGTKAEHVEALTPELIAELRRQVADVFAVLAKQHGLPCAHLSTEALTGDDADAIERLCKLVAVASDHAKALA